MPSPGPTANRIPQVTMPAQAHDEAIYARAQRHLARRDPVLKRLTAQVGPCTLRHSSDHFGTLVRSIISQQISGKAAIAISTRVQTVLGRRGMRPAAILAAPQDQIRAAGVSAAKLNALRDLAAKVQSREVPLAKLPEMNDEEIITHLVKVRGIGRWTAEMFLIFSLGRLDVLPVGDYGLRAGVLRHYGLSELPGRQALMDLAEPWRPYRTVATWYFWRSVGPVPQS